MSKLNNLFIPSVNKLLNALNVKIVLFSELTNNANLYPFTECYLDELSFMKGFYDKNLDTIFLNDNYPRSFTETILHELIHWAGSPKRLDRKWIRDNAHLWILFKNNIKNEQLEMANQEGFATEEATAQIGMLKLILVMNLNPAEYITKTMVYIETLNGVNLEKADMDSDLSVEYLVSSIGMQKIA